MSITKLHHRSHRLTSTKVTIVSLVVDLSDITLNILVAFLTGSVIITTQWLLGLADLLSTTLIFIGIKRSQKPADTLHPFGYGRELFFWTLLASLVMIFITATFSLTLGISQLLNPDSLDYLPLALVVLIINFFTNSFATKLSYQRLRQTAQHQPFLKILQYTSRVETKTTFIKDAVGALSAFIGLINLTLFSLTANTRFDGLGAIIIAFLLLILAIFLLLSVRELIIGRSASLETQTSIINHIKSIKGVLDVLDLRTSIIGPESILVNVEINLEDHLTTPEIELLIDHIKATCIAYLPEIKHIQVELEHPQSPDPINS